MFHVVNPLLSREELEKIRVLASRVQFVDGHSTNADFSQKQNLQASPQDAASQEVSQMLQAAIIRNEWVRDICTPKSLATPLLSKYEPGMTYGRHVDTASLPGNPPVRVDISCTVFLSDPESYDGGELSIQQGDQFTPIKEPAGAAVFYPSTYYHGVTPVTRGERVVGVTFIESHIRSAEQREILFELQDFIHEHGSGLSHDALMKLEFVRLNLLRMWHGR